MKDQLWELKERVKDRNHLFINNFFNDFDVDPRVLQWFFMDCYDSVLEQMPELDKPDFLWTLWLSWCDCHNIIGGKYEG